MLVETGDACGITPAGAGVAMLRQGRATVLFGLRCRVLHPFGCYSWRCATAEGSRVPNVKFDVLVKTGDACGIAPAGAGVAMLRYGRATMPFGVR